MNDTSLEIWRPIPFAPGYSVSTWGRLLTFKRRGGAGGSRIVEEGRNHLVLEAFLGPRPEGMECRHLDGDRANCRLDNLRWGTHSENERDKRRHAQIVRRRNVVNPAAVVEIRRLRASGETPARRRLGPPGHHPARPHRWAHDDASLAALAAYNAARRVDGSLCRLFTEMFGRQPAFPDRLTGDEREELVDFMARP
jgi:hypothetical protein